MSSFSCFITFFYVFLFDYCRVWLGVRACVCVVCYCIITEMHAIQFFSQIRNILKNRCCCCFLTRSFTECGVLANDGKIIKMTLLLLHIKSQRAAICFKCTNIAQLHMQYFTIIDGRKRTWLIVETAVRRKTHKFSMWNHSQWNKPFRLLRVYVFVGMCFIR